MGSYLRQADARQAKPDHPRSNPRPATRVSAVLPGPSRLSRPLMSRRNHTCTEPISCLDGADSVLGATAAPSVKVAFMAQMDSVGNGTLINSGVPGCPTANVSTSDLAFFFRGGVGYFTGKHTFDCGGGNTVTVSFIAHRTSSSAANVGTWKLVDGTGSFVGVGGGGTLSGSGTPGADTFVDYYTGTLRFP